MNLRCRSAGALALLSLAACAGDTPLPEADVARTNQGLGAFSDGYVMTEVRAREIAARGWNFGFPALLMDATRQLSEDQGAVPNQLVHFNEIPDHTFRDVVRPNRDTIYTSAFLDLQVEPWLLTIPAAIDARFVMFQFMDPWSNAFAAPGSRTHTEQGEATPNPLRRYLVLGPNDHGRSFPELDGMGTGVIESPDNGAWMLGRVELLPESAPDGERGMQGVTTFQEGIVLEPLSAFLAGTGMPFAPVDTSEQTPPDLPPVPTLGRVCFDGAQPDACDGSDVLCQTRAMPAVEFFERLTEVIELQPPSPPDPDMLEDLAMIGVRPGEGVDFDALPEHIVAGMVAGRCDAQELIAEGMAFTEESDGWGPNARVPLGDYGTNYTIRSVVAHIGFGANRPEDAAYLTTKVGENLAGDIVSLVGSAGAYTLRLEALPPTHAFWSISVYDAEGYFAKPPADCAYCGEEAYLVGSHTLSPGQTGPIVIRFESPTCAADPACAFDANAPTDAPTYVLPVSDGPFQATLRTYWPASAYFHDPDSLACALVAESTICDPYEPDPIQLSVPLP